MAKPPQIEVRVPRVFCGPDGRFGNPLGVVLDGPSVPVDDRQALATHLGYSETVFVDDAAAGRIVIFTPVLELPFAGHPTVGTAWMLAGEGHPVDVLRPPAGEVPVRRDGELTWVAARPEWCPPWELVRYDTPAEIDAMEVPETGLIFAWAWIDEPAGLVRARCFVVDEGIPEDEATGLGRPAAERRARPRDRGPPGQGLGDPRPPDRRRHGRDRRPGGRGLIGLQQSNILKCLRRDSNPESHRLKGERDNHLRHGGPVSLKHSNIRPTIGVWSSAGGLSRMRDRWGERRRRPGRRRR